MTASTHAAIAALSRHNAPPSGVAVGAACREDRATDLAAFRAHMAARGDTLSLSLVGQWLEGAHTALPVALTVAVAGRARAEADLRARYAGRGEGQPSAVVERAAAYRLGHADEALRAHSRELVERAFTTTHAWTRQHLAGMPRRTVRLYRGLEGAAGRRVANAVADARATGAADVAVPACFLSSWTASAATARQFAGALKTGDRRGVVISRDVPVDEVFACSAVHPMLARSAEDEWIVLAREPGARIAVEDVEVLGEASTRVVAGSA